MVKPRIADKLKEFHKTRRCTLLGINPSSVEIAETAIEYANSHRIPLMLVASRRQVDSKRFGCGYVNKWTARGFAEYVRQKDKGEYVAICRDHGGPWQNSMEVEKKLNLEQAIESAKSSLFRKKDVNKK